jgi:hypothetical protein
MIRKFVTKAPLCLVFVGSVQVGDHMWLPVHGGEHTSQLQQLPPTFHCYKVKNPYGLYVDVCKVVPTI